MSLLEVSDARSWAHPFRRVSEEPLLIVNGHPDPRPERFCAALCQACLAGASGRDAEVVTLGAAYSADGQGSARSLRQALELLREAARLVVVYPLWLDKPPEIVTRFFQDAQRRGIAATKRRAQIVVTMSLPAFAHRSMVRDRKPTGDVLCCPPFPGLDIEQTMFVGSVDTISSAQREEWLLKLRRLGKSKRGLAVRFHTEEGLD